MLTPEKIEELLPCPFCGSSKIDPEGWKSTGGVVGPACDDCGASAGSPLDSTEANTAAWNRRATSSIASASAGDGELIARLDSIASEMTDWDGPLMKAWDGWRAAIAGGAKHSGPRDGFESFMDEYADAVQTAAARLRSLAKEVELWKAGHHLAGGEAEARAEALERDLRAARDHYATIAKDLADRGYSGDAIAAAIRSGK